MQVRLCGLPLTALPALLFILSVLCISLGSGCFSSGDQKLALGDARTLCAVVRPEL